MPAKKKTNYISYELTKLETYLEQLQAFLDKNPPDLAVDRTEIYATARGGEGIKVIASIEDQVKMFLLALEKLPRVLEDINRLRKEVDGGKEEIELRGGADRPGFMDDDEDDEEEEVKPKPKKKPTRKKDQEEDVEPSAFDDDSFFEEEGGHKDDEGDEVEEKQKLLPAPEDHDEGDDDWMDERD
jgi:hypothetical protein